MTEMLRVINEDGIRSTSALRSKHLTWGGIEMSNKEEWDGLEEAE